MYEAKTILTIKEYGKIDVELRKLMDEKGLNRNFIAKATNTRFEVINKWYNNEVEKMDLDVLARICYALDCSPSDIIKYRKP